MFGSAPPYKVLTPSSMSLLASLIVVGGWDLERRIEHGGHLQGKYQPRPRSPVAIRESCKLMTPNAILVSISDLDRAQCSYYMDIDITSLRSLRLCTLTLYVLKDWTSILEGSQLSFGSVSVSVRTVIDHSLPAHLKFLAPAFHLPKGDILTW